VVVYQIYANNSLAATVPASTSATVSGLQLLTTYSFTVRAVDAANNVSSPSNAVIATTIDMPDTTPPSAPTGLTASDITSTSVVLSWTASTDDVGVTGYDVFLGNDQPTTDELVATSTTTSVALSGLASGTYSVALRARDSAGNVSEFSKSLVVTLYGLGGGGACSSASTLASAAKCSNRYFGTWLSASNLNDSVETTIAAREFNMVTAKSEMTPSATEPTQGNFTFSGGDAITNWAIQHGMRVRGYTLAWHSQQPSWWGGISATNLRNAMLSHIQGVMAHYKGKLAYWDVVNEAYSDDGSGSRRSSNLQSTGNDWIEAAFKTARQADGSAKLCYNDYNLENWSSGKTQGVYSMVKSRGVPIDCVGFSSNDGTSGSSLPATFQITLKNFAALGVEVGLTAVEVEDASPSGYQQLTQLCMNVQGCAGISVNGVTDRDASWRDPTTGSGPLLFDANGNKKPAYAYVLEALTVPATVFESGTGR
jgi:GH35 family endo-1,4-beta-xylanase